MPATTPVYAWPYQTLTDPPDGPSLGEDLALAIESTVSGIDTLLASLETAWTSYTPVWTTDGGGADPAIVNGSLSGRYLKLGRLVVYGGIITMGSSTTYGVGGWDISLPHNRSNGTLDILGVAYIRDSSTPANNRMGLARQNDVDRFRIEMGGTVAAAVPVTWATGDVLQWLLVYEAAA